MEKLRNFFEITAFVYLAFEWVMCDDDFPHNVVVMAGSDKLLPCAGGLPFRWYVYPPSNPTEDKVIFMGERMAYNSDPQFRVYLKPNGFPYNRLDLLITNIRPDHFGTYKCQKSGSAHCAELIVLGSDPKCNKYEKTGGDEVQLKCDVNVTINGIPEMNCFHKLNKASIHTHCKRKRASETTVCKAKVPASAEDDYTCVIGVKHQPRLNYMTCVQAADRPSYQFIWDTSTSPISSYSSEHSIVISSPAIVIGLAITFIIIIISVMIFAVLCVKRRRQNAERQNKNRDLLRESILHHSLYVPETPTTKFVGNLIKIYGMQFSPYIDVLQNKVFCSKKMVLSAEMTSHNI